MYRLRDLDALHNFDPFPPDPDALPGQEPREESVYCRLYHVCHLRFKYGYFCKCLVEFGLILDYLQICNVSFGSQLGDVRIDILGEITYFVSDLAFVPGPWSLLFMSAEVVSFLSGSK